jgi:hypothetical protein
MKDQTKPQVPPARPALRPWLIDVSIEHLR